MHYKTFALAALASAASAQNLTTVLAGIPSLSQLGTYLKLYPSVADALAAAQNVTLLAPSNKAFAKFLTSPEGQSLQANNTALVDAFFSYHVLDGLHYASSFNSTPQFFPTALSPTTNLTLLQPGAYVEGVTSGNETQFVSGVLTQSTVVSANHNFTGGTIHVIDTFLTLPQNISATLVPLNLTAAAGALEAANIAAGPLPANLTAFIPNNAAFQAISNILSNLSIADLTGILSYHLVPDIVAYSTDLQNGMKLPTLANKTLSVDVEDNGEVFINGAKVLLPNVIVQEGVVHVIAEVLNPMSSTNSSSSNSTSTSSMSVNPSKTTAAFSGASSGSAVPYTSGIPAPSSIPAAASSAAGAASSAGASASASASGSGNAGAIAKPFQTGAVVLGAAAAVFMGL